jgi:hypothetical protein
MELQENADLAQLNDDQNNNKEWENRDFKISKQSGGK